MNIFLALALSSAIGLACGMANGLVVTVGRVPAIVVTLGTLAVFRGINSPAEGLLHDPQQAHVLRVWQNHGLQLDRVPQEFDLLATSYLCRNQMMVKRSDGQLIYTVQFHLEKSFEDWNKSRTRWEHQNESRDGRILFENFLGLALAHQAT